MNKQIDEMAKAIGDADQKCYEIEDCDDCPFHTTDLGLCKEKFVATELYNAGYRKQSEGEWVVVDSDIGYVESECSLCKHKVLEHTDTAYKFCPNCGARMKGGETDA